MPELRLQKTRDAYRPDVDWKSLPSEPIVIDGTMSEDTLPSLAARKAEAMYAAALAQMTRAWLEKDD